MKNRGVKSSYTVAYFKVHRSTCNEAKTTNVLNRKFLRDNCSLFFSFAGLLLCFLIESVSSIY